MLYFSSPWLIYFITGSLYLLIPSPYFTHPSSPLPFGNHQFVLYSWVCFLAYLFLFFPFAHLVSYVPYIGEIIWYLSLFGWLIHVLLYCLAPSVLLQMVIFHSFLRLNNIPPIIHTHTHTHTHTPHIFFIHSSIDGYLGCFHNLVIVNNATINIGVHVSLWIMFLSLSLFLYYFCFPSLMFICFVSESLHMSEVMIFVFLWLISLSIIPSSSIHVVANGKISLFLIAE